MKMKLCISVLIISMLTACSLCHDVSYTAGASDDSTYKHGDVLQQTSVLRDTHHCDECKSEETSSYLDRPRFHFSGIFKSDTLTINNYYDNFNVDRFEEINEMLARNENAGFNPTGTGDFFFESSTVTMVCPEDGPCSSKNSLVGQLLQSSIGEDAGKMVDLDVEVEEHAGVIYGLSIGIDLDGDRPVVGRLKPAQVTDTWRSVWDVGNATDEGQFGQASIQSVLDNVEWNVDSPLFTDDASGVSILRQMYDKVRNGYLLSVKFNLDHYEELNASDPFFLFGRVSGTIGLVRKTEAFHFTRGRFLHSYKVPDDPEGRSYANVAPFVVDPYKPVLTIDLGNALSRSTFDGSWNNQYLGIGIDLVSQQSRQLIGSVDLSSDNWYFQRAGVFEFDLTSRQHEVVQTETVEVISDTGLLLLSELDYYIRPMRQPFAKLDPGNRQTFDFFVVKLGKSVCNFPVDVAISSISQRTVPDKLRKAIDAIKMTNGERTTGNSKTSNFVSDCNGHFRVAIEATDPGNVRGFVDGEIYQMDVMLGTIIYSHQLIRLYDDFSVPEEPTWYGKNGVERIVKLYEMLYPFTRPSLFESKYEDITHPSKQQLLISRLSLDQSSPRSLPVARDLSRGKRDTLIKWLQNPKEGQRGD